MFKNMMHKIFDKISAFYAKADLDTKALEFQPDALELEKKPVPLSTRLTYYLLLTMVIIALIWSIVAKMDMIVAARGKLISTGKQVVVQPLVNAIIKEFHVDVGQTVKEGQVLISLDPTFAMADEAQIKSRLGKLKVQIKRLESELARESFLITPDMDPEEAVLQLSLFRGREREYNAKNESYTARISQAKDEVSSFTRRLESLNRLLKSAEEVLSMRNQVFEEGADSRLSVVDAETRFSAAQAEAEGVANDLNVRKQQIFQYESERDAFISNWQNDIADTLATTRKDHDALVEQLSKAARYRELSNLSSPVDAVVLDIQDYSVGSVVKEGMPIMTLVPLNTPIEAEVYIETKDIGYVHLGDKVRIKLDAFPFQRHGTLEGQLRVISEDAYVVNSGENVNKVSTFQGRVELTKTDLLDVSKDTRLLPGMTLAAELVVGERRVITFLAYPIIRGLDESLREP